MYICIAEVMGDHDKPCLLRLRKCIYNVHAYSIFGSFETPKRHAKPVKAFVKRSLDPEHTRTTGDTIEQAAVVDGNVLRCQDLDDLLRDHAAC